MKKTVRRMEEIYLGITERIMKLENGKLPECSHCSSMDATENDSGIVLYTIELATATSKFHLRPNDK